MTEPSREELAAFYSAIFQAQQEGSEGVDAERSLIEHFNRGKMAAIDETGYFIYHDVKVFEKGRRKEALEREALTIEDKIFGGKK